MARIRVGAPGYLSVRPLIYGLTERLRADVELTYAEPGQLATALEQEKLDVALVPSIEFLRGVGNGYVEGPGLVIQGKTGGILLVSDRPMGEIKRIAVAENSRTPVAVLRILLDKTHGVLPDFCVFKGDADGWRKDYDAILLTGDQGPDYCINQLEPNETRHDLGEMWCSLNPAPLILAMWVYNDEEIAGDIETLLIRSRDRGVKNLSLLADEASKTTRHDGQFIYEYLSRGWSYRIGRQEEAALVMLEDYAIDYQLIQHRRLGKVLTRQS